MIQIEKKEVGAYHKYLCKKIKEKRENNLDISNKLVIKRDDFKRMLGWFNIPAYIQSKVISEMEAMGLIKIKDKQNIILVKQKNEGNGWFD